MEHAQRDEDIVLSSHFDVVGLNPYFNGTCSKSCINPINMDERPHRS